jgi:hypothetical protein
MFPPVPISTGHARMLARAEADHQRQAAAEDDLREVRRQQARVGAGTYAETMELVRAQALAEQAAAERKARQEREQRAADRAAWREAMLISGQGRLRTVPEVLADTAALMALADAEVAGA